MGISPHPGRPPFPGPDFLDDLKRFLVNDGLMGIFKDLPLIGSMLDFLMALVRLVVRLKVYQYAPGQSTRSNIIATTGPFHAYLWGGSTVRGFSPLSNA